MRANLKSRIIVVVIAALGVVGAQAQAWFYTDVADGFYHTNIAANTYNASTDSSTDWIGYVDGTPNWRFRDTGPAVPSYDLSAYDGRYVGDGVTPDPALYTLLSGLAPNTTYTSVRVYGVYPRSVTNASNKPRYGAQFSTDGGTTWWAVDSHIPQDEYVGGYTWVDNSSGIGSVLSVPGTGDTRFFSWLPAVTTDASGVARIDIRVPHYLQDGSLQDRFNLDGYAVAIPEPSVLALAAAALVIFRRRR